ncbi:MAG: hypothetical protein AAGG38_14855 [Planctomycetota bacterium]
MRIRCLMSVVLAVLALSLPGALPAEAESGAHRSPPPPPADLPLEIEAPG